MIEGGSYKPYIAMTTTSGKNGGRELLAFSRLERGEA